MSTFPSLLTLLLLAIATPAFSTPIERRASPVVSSCKHDFAMTFDDGPYLWQDEIVDEFSCLGVKTTFFVNGNRDGCIYSEDNVQRIRYAHSGGHAIGSQTWSNADLSTLTEAQIDVEIQRLDEAFVKILGVKPKLFRAPNNSLPESAANYIATKYGKTVVGSDTDSGDTNAGATTQGIYDFYHGLASQGAGTPHLVRSSQRQIPTLDAIDMGAVEALGNAGIKLITVAECLDIAPYDVIGSYGVRDASWTCDGSWSPPTAATCVQTYTATATDKTCTAIAAKVGVSAQALYLANPTLNCQDVWQWTPICVPAATAPLPVTCAQRYTTTAAETCQSIATKFGVTAESVLNANPFVGCNDIWSGTSLCIVAPTPVTCASTYNAIAGDTCVSIATKFGISSGDKIKSANTFLNCADIWANTPICIPSARTPSSTTITTATTSTTSSGSPAPTCVQTYKSVSQDNCVSIGAKFGLTGTAISNANSFVNCNDIWVNTSICIPSGGSTTTAAQPAPTCASTYKSVSGDNCVKIGAKFGLTEAAIKNANTFVNCSDVWVNTPLCIPPGGQATACTNTISSWSGATCDTLASAYGTTSANIKLWNSFVDCANIWTNTPICVAH